MTYMTTQSTYCLLFQTTKTVHTAIFSPFYLVITFLSQAKDVILEGCKVRGSWAYQNVAGGASTECSLSVT